MRASARYRRLETVGIMIHGDNWRTPMAAALGISRMTVNNWSRDPRPMDADVDAKLLALLLAQRAVDAERAALREKLIADLEKEARHG